MRDFSSNEVCEATGLRRTTLDAWILRRYLTLAEGPGTGRERRFTLEEAAVIAVAAELTRLGLSVGLAARGANYVFSPNGKPMPLVMQGGWHLVVGPGPWGMPPGVDASSMSPLGLFQLETGDDLYREIERFLNNPTSAIVVDVSKLAERTLERLHTASPTRKKGRPKKAR